MCQKDLWVSNHIICRVLLSPMVYFLWNSALLWFWLCFELWWSLCVHPHVFMDGNTGVLVYCRFSWLSLHPVSFWHSESRRWCKAFFLGITMVTQQQVYKEKLFMMKCVLSGHFQLLFARWGRKERVNIRGVTCEYTVHSRGIRPWK